MTLQIVEILKVSSGRVQGAVEAVWRLI